MVCHLTDAFLMGTEGRPVSVLTGWHYRTVVKWVALYVPLPQAPARYADWLGRDVVFGVRPEHIGAVRPGEAAARAVLDCRIDVVEPTGTDTMVFFELGTVEMVARIDAHATVRPGEVLRLAIDAARTSLFDPGTGRRI